jgi:patatin-related protein
MEQDKKRDEGNSNEGASREIRVALVLYGGVSLAVYENGVTEAFFDLVKGNGVFKPILKLLDASAVVDVIAGTSAGGINGLLLATALSAGSEFKETANLWREHGDIGTLMRPVAKAGNAESLLDGEGYYQEHLKDAFKMLLEKGDPDQEGLGEIDVFITGTDLAGHVRTCWDLLGDEIEDKSHRVVFQLKYRPGRRPLGLTAADVRNLEGADGASARKFQNLLEKQATILASIARITSTFPAAFPPFRLAQIDKHLQEGVRLALEDCGGLSGFESLRHIYVDGGVLDNKPFGPVLRAIFYRVPLGLVDRRLFYVEPDPEHITQLGATEEQKLINPVGTVVSCLSTIPSHQSISEDLDRLREHNARVKWLKELKTGLAKHLEAQPQTITCRSDAFQQDAYHRVRIDSIARSLVLELDAIPSAGDHMVNSVQERLLASLKAEFIKISSMPDGMATITSYDIDYHLRRAFHILYKLYGGLERAKGDTETTQTAMQATSRIVKLIKLVRDMLFMLRDNTVPRYVASGNPTPQAILDIFVPFLAADAPHWKPVTDELRNGFSLAMLAERNVGPLSSQNLSKVAREARSEVVTLAGVATEEGVPDGADPGTKAGKDATIGPNRHTILDEIGEVLRKVICAWCGDDVCFEEFQVLDRIFFPLEFACGIHELDEIELVRISPKDAQTGLSEQVPQKKVTGDELAHFAAFFRRDWRSNDILWGKVDGICQIVCSLLDKDAFERLLARKESLRDLMDQEDIHSSLPGCPEPIRTELENAWRRFAAALNGNPEILPGEAFEVLKEKLILAGQHEAVNTRFKGLYEDMYFQEISWGNCKEEEKIADTSGLEAIGAAAKIWAKKVMRATKGENRGEAFKKMAMGSQTVAGKSGRVPMRVLGEYISQAYLLLWGMMETALGGKKAGLSGNRKIRLFFRSPVWFIYHYISVMRTEQRLLPVLLGALCAALLASGVTGIILGNKWFVIPLIIPFVLIALYSRLR